MMAEEKEAFFKEADAPFVCRIELILRAAVELWHSVSTNPLLMILLVVCCFIRANLKAL
jgi:hypothetical protein